MNQWINESMNQWINKSNNYKLINWSLMFLKITKFCRKYGCYDCKRTWTGEGETPGLCHLQAGQERIPALQEAVEPCWFFFRSSCSRGRGGLSGLSPPGKKTKLSPSSGQIPINPLPIIVSFCSGLGHTR